MFAEQFASDFNWSLIFTALMAIATMGMWWDARKNRTPQPFEVSVNKELHEKFASREEVEALAAEVKEDFKLVAKERQDDLRMAAISRRTMYDKQDTLRKEMSDRIDQLPERIIATLRNTGAIGRKHD